MIKKKSKSKKMNTRLTLLAAFLLAITLAFLPADTQAASKPTLSATKVTLKVGKTKKLKVKNTGKKKIKWSSSNKKVATVSSSGKVKARKTGKTTITAKVGKKKLKCKVTVKKAKKSTKCKTTLDGYEIPVTELEKYKKIVKSVLGEDYTKKSEAERAWLLAKWICDHREYKYPTFVCTDYADLYFCLMNTAGVRCVVAVSYSSNHAWNEVRVDGKWYVCDVTQLDNAITGHDIDKDEEYVYSKYTFESFMKSDKGVKEASGGLDSLGHGDKNRQLISWGGAWFDFKLNSLPRCTSTKYDNAEKDINGKHYDIWTSGDYKNL